MQKQSIADSTVRLFNSVYHVHDIIQQDGITYLELRQFKVVKNLFKRPVHSMSVGICRVGELSDDTQLIVLNKDIIICFCLPYGVLLLPLICFTLAVFVMMGECLPVLQTLNNIFSRSVTSICKCFVIHISG